MKPNHPLRQFREQRCRFLGEKTIAAFGLTCGLAFAVVVVGCGPIDEPADAGPSPAGTLPALQPPTLCGETLAGPTPAAVVEMQSGYAEDAAAALATSAPTFPVDLTAMQGFQRATINFMLGRTNGESIEAADVDAAGELGAAVNVAIAAGGGDDVDFIMLRRGLFHAYLCSRPLPPDLETLKLHFGDFTQWNETWDVGCSRAKNATRRLYAHPDGAAYVAETIGADGSVRETEVLFHSTRDDGHLDFAVYTDEGFITDRSTFATPSSELVLAAPYTCLTCHIDQTEELMSRVDATGTGAGCQ